MDGTRGLRRAGEGCRGKERAYAHERGHQRATKGGEPVERAYPHDQAILKGTPDCA